MRAMIHGNRLKSVLALGVAAIALAPWTQAAADVTFAANDLVVVVEGNGSGTGTYTDNQAAPMTLQQFQIHGTSQAATEAGSLELSQTQSGSNYAVSGEYGSSSEGILQLTGNGKALTVMGYGVTASTFNANPGAFGGVAGNTALAQSSMTAVPRVVAVVSANGQVNSSTALTNVFDQNNPRSVYSANGTSFYVAGQGNKGDETGGVFYATLGSHTATSITGNDNTTKGATSSQDARDVQIVNGQLVVSVDSSQGQPTRNSVGTLGSVGSLPTSVANGGAGTTPLPGMTTSTEIAVSSGNDNSVNASAIGKNVYTSPEQFFFANSTTLYVADGGDPKNSDTKKGTSGLGDGGLQKWTLSNGVWHLDYTLSAGLDLVANTSASGVSGLFGLTGKVVGNDVELFATSYTLTDTGQTYLYGITDNLAALTNPGETFDVLAAAAPDTDFKGVSFGPGVPEPATWVMMIVGFGLVGFVLRRRGRSTVAAA